MKKKHIVLAVIALLLVVAMIWLIWSNVTVGLTSITVTEENLPAGFDGFRIAHISDLHNSGLWKQTVDLLREAKPEIICITGDMVDSYNTDLSVAFSFAEEAVKIAPCYYITGNHEVRIAEYEAFLQGLRDRGVTVLMNESVILSRGEDEICLVGHQWGDTDELGQLTEFEGYNLLLSHQPDRFSEYVAGDYDLVLTGHAHGGQFRLPFVGGLYAPGQGVLPAYDSGLYSDGNTDMIVSRGIGNSAFPIRFNNRPEVILVQLRCK